jgi:hypothetical protein
MPGPTNGAFNADPTYKQPAQEGGTSAMPSPSHSAFNADPSYKQRTQEGGTSLMPGPADGYNADGHKQRARNLTPTSNQSALDDRK